MKESVAKRFPYTSASRAVKNGSQKIPTERGRFLTGVLPEFRQDPLNLYVRVMQEHGDFVKVFYGPFAGYHVSHPDHVKRILIDNNHNYSRNKRGNRLLKLITGENLVTSDGEMWRKQRRLLQPAFHRKRINGFGNLMTDSANQMLERWSEFPAGQVLDVDKEIKDLTFTIVGLALFGVDLSNETSGMGRVMTAGSEYFSYRLGNVLAPPLWVPTRRNRTFKNDYRVLAHLGPQMVRERREEIEQKGTADEAGRQFDMMDLLLEARYEETGEGMSDEQLITEINTMLGAGHETTANTLSWTLYLLSQYPEAEAKLQEEVDRVLSGQTPTVEDLGELTYTRMMLNESMRLYPAAWAMARQSIESDQLGPYTLPADASVLIPVYAIHRHPDFWDEPDHFNPERFSPEKEKAIHRFAFFPFGGGPRQCIGQSFALMEAQLILAMIVQRYRLRLVPGHIVEPQPLITLRMKHGLMMTLEQR